MNARCQKLTWKRLATWQRLATVNFKLLKSLHLSLPNGLVTGAAKLLKSLRYQLPLPLERVTLLGGFPSS